MPAMLQHSKRQSAQGAAARVAARPLLPRGSTRRVVAPPRAGLDASQLSDLTNSINSIELKSLNVQDLSSQPKEVLYAAGAAVAGVLGLLGYAAANNPDMGFGAAGEAGEAAAEPQAPEPAPLPRKDAVLVFGATGRLGRRVVEKLVRSGRTVVAAARSAERAAEVFAEAGLAEGYQQPPAGGSGAPGSGGILITAGGVDVTDAATLTAGLFEGVSQVVLALGPVAGRLPDGTFGYIDDMTPERVEAQGTSNILAALAEHAPGLAAAAASGRAEQVLPMATEDDLKAWERLDDVIMGGNSSSGLAPAEDGSGAVWKGDLIVEGGGFCGARTKPLGLDLSSFDGLQLRVRGDGQIFKFNIKTADQEDVPESTYQATFDTSPDGDWATVRLPWHSFVPVKRAQVDYEDYKPLDPSSISKMGLVLSRFQFNKQPNPLYRPGPFTLNIQGGISAYREPRPAVVSVSSAGVERNAIIGDDAEARKRDLPIVQLNPGGILNYKYEAESWLRDSGLPYTVVRCTGLDDKDVTGPALLQADQGDSISGKVSRAEVADVVAAALSRPDAANKTFELRRSEAADAQGKEMSEAALTRLFLQLSLDRNRWRVGLRPMPRAVPPPPPPSEERTKEILADPRVAAVRARNQAASAEQQREGQQEGQQGEGAAAAAGKAQEEEEEEEKELVSASA